MSLVGNTSPFELPTIVKNRTLTTDFNRSYGQFPETRADTEAEENGYVTNDQTYEEIRASKLPTTDASPEYEINKAANNRPPAPLPIPVPTDQPSTEVVYVEADDSNPNGSISVSPKRQNIVNPAYGKTERERISTAAEYLIVTEKDD